MKETLRLVWGRAVHNLPVITLVASQIMKEPLPHFWGRPDPSLSVAQLLVLLHFRKPTAAPPPVQELVINPVVVRHPILPLIAALHPPVVPVDAHL